MLSMIWYILIEDFTQARRELNTLKKRLPNCSQPLILLRTVELGSLRQELALAGLMPDAEIEALFHLGRTAFAELSKPLQTYGCSDELRQLWKGLLTTAQPGPGFLLDRWASDEMTEMRSRVWP